MAPRTLAALLLCLVACRPSRALATSHRADEAWRKLIELLPDYSALAKEMGLKENTVHDETTISNVDLPRVMDSPVHNSSACLQSDTIEPDSDDVADSVRAAGVDAEFASLTSVLLRHASAVYEGDRQALASWTCERCKHPLVSSFQPFRLIHDEPANLEAYAGFDPSRQLIVVSFRGTHLTAIVNWLADLSAIPLKLPDVPHAYVHRGFFSAYFCTKMASFVDLAVLLLHSRFPSFTIAITGHSLGAALATLAALHLQVAHSIPPDRLRLVTFGSPRVGNTVFSSFLHHHVPHSLRVTNQHDPVVHLPGVSMMYHHIPRELWIINNNSSKQWQLELCDVSGEDKSCSRSVIGDSIHNHLVYFGVQLHYQKDGEGDVLDDFSSLHLNCDTTWFDEQEPLQLKSL